MAARMRAWRAKATRFYVFSTSLRCLRERRCSCFFFQDLTPVPPKITTARFLSLPFISRSITSFSHNILQPDYLPMMFFFFSTRSSLRFLIFIITSDDASPLSLIDRPPHHMPPSRPHGRGAAKVQCKMYRRGHAKGKSTLLFHIAT